MTIKEFYDEMKMIHAEDYDIIFNDGYEWHPIDELEYEIDDENKGIGLYCRPIN